MYKLIHVFIVSLFFSSSISQAAVVITALESGGDVIISTLGGSFDLTGLSGPTQGGTGGGTIIPSNPTITIGETDGFEHYYTGIVGPSSFGSGAQSYPDFNNNGDAIGIHLDRLYVPLNYTSGDPIGVSSSTYVGETFASLGMTPGTYVWTWTGDSITLNVSSVPLPAGVWLFASAIFSLAGVQKYKKLM